MRGLLFEARGSAGPEVLDPAAEKVEAWGERFRIPVGIVRADPADHEAWVEEALSATKSLVT